jgi:hypothetical protein
MATQYIIKFKKNTDDDECFKVNDIVDCYVELSEYKTNRMKIPTIEVRTCKDAGDDTNVVLLYKHITNKFAKVDFNDSERMCTIIYNGGYNQKTTYTSTMKFDDSSSSAYSDFKTNFESSLNSSFETEYYPSGRVMYIGEMLYNKTEDGNPKNRVPNGDGTLYFNSFNKAIKYDGEFDDGKYDGRGQFYNKEGKITLTALNISNGIPTQKGKLNINFTNKHEVIELTFSEIWEKLGLTNKEQRKKFVMNDNFVNEITKLYWKNDDVGINELSFRENPASEQRSVLWKELKSLRFEITRMNISSNKLSETNTSQLVHVVLITFFINISIHILRATIC